MIKTWEFETGADAEFVESFVLDVWNTLPHAVVPSDMPSGGHTETASLDDVTETEALAPIDATVDVWFHSDQRDDARRWSSIAGHDA
jgi:hypothetical protein